MMKTMDLKTVQQAQGAQLAPDRIPLHFGDQAVEYQAALNSAIIVDRSHEARLRLAGASALALIHRISTNAVENLAINTGAPTIFTNPNGRILDRAAVFQQDDHVLMLGEPGRSQPLGNYLQRNIFFGDDVQLTDLAETTSAFDVHGPQAAAIIGQVAPDAATLSEMQGAEALIDESSVYIVQRKPVHEQRWTLIVPQVAAADVWSALVVAGAQPAGSLVYNVLRVRAGLPSVGRELSDQYIPLEIGLWDEVSFTKGCYTGQEIIARMESRQRLAKMLVRLHIAEFVAAPTDIFLDGRGVGQLTSSVTAPDGAIFALGVIKTSLALNDQPVEVGADRVNARVIAPAGVFQVA